MNESKFAALEDVIRVTHFPEVDLALRRGRHIGRDDGSVYDFLADALDHLEPFYRRYGCELVHRSDGYFYLLPSGDRLGRRVLSAGEMLAGQTLALLYLDPATLAHGGVVTRELLLHRLSGLLGAETLVRTLNPQKRKFNERSAGETVRMKLAEALRKLADLGFVDIIDERDLRLRPALLRFADPVRGIGDSTRALEQLVIRGEVLLADARDDDDVSTETDDSTELETDEEPKE